MRFQFYRAQDLSTEWTYADVYVEEMRKQRSATTVFLLAAGAAAGYVLYRRARIATSAHSLMDRCEHAAEALDRRLNWLSGLAASEESASKSLPIAR